MSCTSSSPHDQRCVSVDCVKPGLTIKLPNVSRVRDINTQRLLESKKLHLVLDLDQTLIHSTGLDKLTTEERECFVENAGNLDNMYLIMDGTKVVKLRPGVREFLEKASALFDISVYTMGTELYAKWVVDMLNPDPNSDNGSWSYRIGKVVSREDCTVKKRKGLDVVLSHKRVVLIVDDKDRVWMECDRANVITLKPYYFFGKKHVDDDKDDELSRVFEVLREVHSRFFNNVDGDNGGFDCEIEKRDVREVLQDFRIGLREGQATSDYDNLGRKKRARREDEEPSYNCVQAMLEEQSLLAAKRCKWLGMGMGTGMGMGMGMANHMLSHI